MPSLFDKSGGYRRLHSFTFATMIHLETIRFCKRFIPCQDDPLGKTAGQMIGAARSGRQNIIEGSGRAATSKETEIKLTVVANTIIILISRTMSMLAGQIRHQGEAFLEQGGFRERMHRCRTEVCSSEEEYPDCPECGAPMVPRTAKDSKFWGCARYPKCRGSRSR